MILKQVLSDEAVQSIAPQCTSCGRRELSILIVVAMPDARGAVALCERCVYRVRDWKSIVDSAQLSNHQ